MATLVLPKDMEFNDGEIARGTDVRANDQAIRDWLNTTSIDQANINMTGAFDFLGVVSFVGGSFRVKGAGSGSAAFQNANTSTSRTATVPDPGSDFTLAAIELEALGFYNIGFAQGADSSILKITSANGAALSTTNNKGYVRIQSSTAGTFRTFTVTADVTIDLTGAHWGLNAKGSTTASLLRIYAIDDGGTLKWGVGYCGGFEYIRNTQDSTTATTIDLPEEILVNSDVSTDNSPVMDVGHVEASFTDATNEWAITAYRPGLKSADGKWQPWSIAFTGFSSNPATPDARWAQVGKMVTIKMHPTNGTSNATTLTVTAPIRAFVGTEYAAPGSAVVNNGVNLGAPGLMLTTSGSATIACYRDVAFSAWTNVNAKTLKGMLSYEMFQP